MLSRLLQEADRNIGISKFLVSGHSRKVAPGYGIIILVAIFCRVMLELKPLSLVLTI